MEKGANHRSGIGGQSNLFQRFIHELDPAMTGRLINGEGSVPHPQLGVPTLSQIMIWTAEPKD